MRYPNLEDCSKQKWTANGKSLKNPTRTPQGEGLAASAVGVSNVETLYRVTLKSAEASLASALFIQFIVKI